MVRNKLEISNDCKHVRWTCLVFLSILAACCAVPGENKV